MISNATLEKLKYPIGKFQLPSKIDATLIQYWITSIATFPEQLITAIDGLSDLELEWIYRPNGWSIKQLVHHCADSHMNILICFKIALTEEAPIIRPYDEKLWALLPDAKDNVSDSLNIIKGVHKKWGKLMQSFNEEQWKLFYIHPDFEEPVTLEKALGLYAWHGNHHLAHIQQALLYKGVF